MVWPVFKTAMEAPSAAPVGSIPTRSRHSPATFSRARIRNLLTLRRSAFLIALPALIVLWLAPGPAAAQDSVMVDSAAALGDLLPRPVSPMGAFWRSFLVPGWGQARLNRKLTGGLFIAWEGITLGMSLRTRHELAHLRQTGSGSADRKRQEHEDWIVLLAFNHLFSGLEAYVSAHLTDFPGDLRFQAVPGGAGATMSIPFRLR